VAVAVALVVQVIQQDSAALVVEETEANDLHLLRQTERQTPVVAAAALVKRQAVQAATVALALSLSATQTQLQTCLLALAFNTKTQAA
jgi:hypothetical protein